MINKWVNFFILWGMLVMVQGFAITIMDFSSNMTTMIVTATGTALTLVLGLRVERQRVTREVHRETADKKSDEIRRIQEAMISKALPAAGFDLNDLDTPSYMKTPGLSDRHHLPLFIHPGLLDEPTPKTPQPSAHFVVDGDKVYKPDGFMPQNWEAIADEEEIEMFPKPEPDICKHCYRQINGAVHAEGMARGRMRCDPEDTLGGYGYNAESTDVECGPTCLGHK